MNEQAFLRRCIEIASTSVTTGGGPFGALIVRDGEIVGESPNRVAVSNDPTAHAEVEAIRAAAWNLGDPHLGGCILFASCEPCPMCLAAALWAHVSGIVFAATHCDAAQAGFDDTVIAKLLYGQEVPRQIPEGFLRRVEIPSATRPFQDWAAKPDRAEY